MRGALGPSSGRTRVPCTRARPPREPGRLPSESRAGGVETDAGRGLGRGPGGRGGKAGACILLLGRKCDLRLVKYLRLEFLYFRFSGRSRPWIRGPRHRRGKLACRGESVCPGPGAAAPAGQVFPRRAHAPPTCEHTATLGASAAAASGPRRKTQQRPIPTTCPLPTHPRLLGPRRNVLSVPSHTLPAGRVSAGAGTEALVRGMNSHRAR